MLVAYMSLFEYLIIYLVFTYIIPFLYTLNSPIVYIRCFVTYYVTGHEETWTWTSLALIIFIKSL